MHSYQIVVAVANSDKRLTDVIRGVWGGRYRRDQDLTQLRKRYTHTKKDHSVYFNRSEAKRFLRDVYPHLRARQDEVAIVLQALFLLPDENALALRGLNRLPRGSTRALEPLFLDLQEARKLRG